jgi:tetratricopeptide (TPR) repeat protein
MEAGNNSSHPSAEAQQHLELAYAYEERNEFERALRECELAIQLAPDWAEAHNLQGIVLEGLERGEDAIAAYREAVRLDPAFHEARENLAEAEAELREEKGEFHKVEVAPLKQLVCDRCDSRVDYPHGYCLDAKMPGDEELDRKQKLLQRLFEHGATGVVHIRRPGYFTCDSCFEKLYAEQGVVPDPTQKEMSKNQALYFWETGKWERPMRPDEFPPISVEEQLPWFNRALEKAWKESCGGHPSEKDYLAARAQCLARLLEVHMYTGPRDRLVHGGRRFVAIVSELSANVTWQEFVTGFLQRRLLQDIGEGTKVYYLPYTHPIWFSQRMAALAATAIASRVQESTDSLSYRCYLDSDGGHILVVVG